MRDFKGMKRQRGRNRSGNPSGGNNKPQQNANRAFDSTGPENIKVRGHAQHVFEKYQQLARDATSSGDRVLAENFLQHAEHYFRVLRTLQPNRPVSDFMARDTYNSNYDIDFEDESGAQADPEPTPVEQGDGEANAQTNQGGERQDYQSRDNRDQNGYRDNRDQNQNRDRDRDQNRDRQGQGGQGQNRNRYENDRNRNQNRDQNQNRDDFRRDERQPRAENEGASEVRDDRPREDRNSQRDERPREDRSQQPQREPREYRGDRPDRNEGRRERSYEPRGERADPMAVVEPKAAPLISAPERPERSTERASEADSGSVLRSQDGSVSHAPAFLQAAPTPAATPDETPVKRPRGRPRKIVAPAGEDA